MVGRIRWKHGECTGTRYGNEGLWVIIPQWFLAQLWGEHMYNVLWVLLDTEQCVPMSANCDNEPHKKSLELYEHDKTKMSSFSRNKLNKTVQLTDGFKTLEDVKLGILNNTKKTQALPKPCHIVKIASKTNYFQHIFFRKHFLTKSAKHNWQRIIFVTKFVLYTFLYTE